MKNGAADYLVKPVGIDELLLSVSSAMNQSPLDEHDMAVDFDPHGWFEVTGNSDYTVLYRYRKFLGLLNRFRIPEPVANEIRLTLEELGRNAIEWGNRNDRAKKVRFGCRILPSKLIILIADEGEGFDPGDLPDPSVDPIAHIETRQNMGKRLGGYGVHLVRNIMDKVTWNEKGNKVIAIKYLHAPSP
jgi:serine/threonine-protein kinase RsbW